MGAISQRLLHLYPRDKLNEIRSDLPPGHVPHIELEFCHFLFLNAGMSLALEDDISMNCVE
jgi:hypothetical protein